MKLFLFVFILADLCMSACSAVAQVNLDRPIAAGPSDKIFMSSIELDTAYIFPIALVVSNTPTFKELDNSTAVATFGVSYSQRDLDRAKAELKKTEQKHLNVRFFRPLKYEMAPGIDIPPSTKPKLEMTNDFSFDGTSVLTLTIDSFKRRWRARSSGSYLLATLFNSDTSNHIAGIKYEYLATSEGQSGRMRTAVAIYTQTKEIQTQSEFFSLNDILVLDDSVVSCWDSVEPGVFCFRKTAN